MIPLIPIAMSLAQYAPKLVGWLAGDKAEETAEKVVNIAQNITGEQDPQKAVEAIKADPACQIKFQEQANQFELEKSRLVFGDQAGGREIVKTALLSDDPIVRQARPRMMIRLGNSCILFAVYAPLSVIAAGHAHFAAATMTDFMGMLKWIGAFLFSAFMTSFTGYTVARSADKKIVAGGAPGKALSMIAGLGKKISY